MFNLLSDGTITVAGLLDYETDFVYSLVIEAADGGFPSLTGTTTITIGITDINDNAPMFTNPDAMILVAEVTWIGLSCSPFNMALYTACAFIKIGVQNYECCNHVKCRCNHFICSSSHFCYNRIQK